MKTLCLILCVNLLSAVIGNGQGFIYDQQSATGQAGGAGFPIQLNQPMGQSFTPTLSSIGFVQFEFLDTPPNGLDTTLFVNLWSGSISNSTLLSSTDPILVPDGAFNLIATFTFSTPMTVTPGTTYFLQPYTQSGDITKIDVIASQIYNYSGGTAYFAGAPDPNNSDLWFREGIVSVPEPSSSLFMLLGSGLFIFTRYKRKKCAQLF